MLPNDWQQTIEAAYRKFQAGETQIDAGLEELGMYVDNNCMFVELKAGPNSEEAAAVLEYVRKLSPKARQLQEGIFTTHFSLPA